MQTLGNFLKNIFRRCTTEKASQPRGLNVADLGHLFEIALQHLPFGGDTLQSTSHQNDNPRILLLGSGDTVIGQPPKWCEFFTFNYIPHVVPEIIL